MERSGEAAWRVRGNVKTMGRIKKGEKAQRKCLWAMAGVIEALVKNMKIAKITTRETGYSEIWSELSIKIFGQDLIIKQLENTENNKDLVIEENKYCETARACDDYWSEFRHCKSLRNCFHYYYTYGTSPSCKQWKEDYHNCKEWEKHRGAEAKDALQKSERNRVAAQRNFTPVWELRRNPPRDWHMPLNQEKPQDS